MPTQQIHPSVEDLTAFSVGQLSSGEAATVESHINTCEPCSETLMGLSSEDTFVALLKEANVPIHGSATEATALELTVSDDTTRKRPSALAEHPRYEIVGLIAKGGMGDVFKAEHRMMERTVALKVINRELTRNPEAVERFHREVRTAARLSHPNIVTSYDAEQADDIHFLVMENVDGVNLAELVKSGGRLSVADACEYALQAAGGLQYAHERGMVHRDIKPHNLMLTTDGTIKILDFGLASLVEKTLSAHQTELPEQADLTAAGAIMGTPDFISPEQAADAHQADIRSDIYSLGATLHYLLSGKPPFADGSVAEKLKSHSDTQPVSISSLRDDVPERLSDIIHRMMSKDPDQRFQTPREVADALAPFVEKYKTKTPVNLPENDRGGRSWWPPTTIKWVACAVFGFILAGIIYVETNKGTLVIESDDDTVKVTISRATNDGGGTYIQTDFVDTVTGTVVKRLPSGDYIVSLGDQGNRFELSKGGFTLTRGGDVVIKVTRKRNDQQESRSMPPMTLPVMAQQAFLSQGSKLTAEAAEELQNKADSDPKDFGTRLQLMAFYSRRSLLSPEVRPQHQKLVLWLVKNYPESAAAGSHQAHIHAHSDPDGYVKAKNLWLQQAEAHGENVTILRNAARFFLLPDRRAAEELLRLAQAVEPDNADVAQALGQLYKLGLIYPGSKQERRKLAQKSMEQFEIAVRQDAGKSKNHPQLPDLATVAFEAGAADKARQYANQLLEASDDGRAIHIGNVVLGRLAVREGDIEQAKSHLLDAARIQGGPTLSSFGPNMSLAQELLEKGEMETVLEYFQLCGKFWENAKLKEWTDVVNRGGTPAFGGNLSY